ncbi:hypothetical protein BDM02DRAFT_3191421 [Thelephora ganbajun]|uniref:Uncharacterized protein n=1 Tax=Thelephora ganbajun TaxID=370292 RepID=A0ACB6Z1L8_THEGA|nr:hypothetical protein BDM02DRAFT_3191421 [Thelephora ganbajun]
MPGYGGQIGSFAVIDDLNDDFVDALHGVHVLIYLISPLAGREDTKGLPKDRHCYSPLRSSAKVRTKYISFTGSLGALGEFAEPILKAPLTDKDWGSYTEGQVLASDNTMITYYLSKKVAAQALWKLADKALI